MRWHFCVQLGFWKVLLTSMLCLRRYGRELSYKRSYRELGGSGWTWGSCSSNIKFKIIFCNFFTQFKKGFFTFSTHTNINKLMFHHIILGLAGPWTIMSKTKNESAENLISSSNDGVILISMSIGIFLIISIFTFFLIYWSLR